MITMKNQALSPLNVPIVMASMILKSGMVSYMQAGVDIVGNWNNMDEIIDMCKTFIIVKKMMPSTVQPMKGY